MAIALLDQQRLFAEAYVLGHGNATQASIEAGYSPASARQTASRLATRRTSKTRFGVQVIGRIVRRHALLQTRSELPPLLEHGYVFLANAASQEGLLDAGEQINAMTTRAPELGTQTVVTVVGDSQHVQVVRSGEPLSLLVSARDAETLRMPDSGAAQADPGDVAGSEREVWTRAARDLLQLAGDEGEGRGGPNAKAQCA